MRRCGSPAAAAAMVVLSAVATRALVTVTKQPHKMGKDAPSGPAFGRHTFDPLDYPLAITRLLMCKACYASIKEFNKRVPMLLRLKSKLSQVRARTCSRGKRARSHAHASSRRLPT